MISYLRGDATSPQSSGPKLIAHISNTIGGWGRGFVLALSARWPDPERFYRAWYHRKDPSLVQKENPKFVRLEMTGRFALGESQLVQVRHDTFVLNMIAQEGTKTGSKGPPIRYEALALCLRHADKFARDLGASIHGPRFGCGLAGGSWEKVGPLVEKLITQPVTIYDF
jgi:O-acetyl-ADP-ribose deacetylase (regulator of RNase III)